MPSAFVAAPGGTVGGFPRKPGGVHLHVKLTPKAKADRIQGFEAGADGRILLKVQVTAAPEKGRANDALIEFLARTWRLPKRAIGIAAGAHDRKKVLLIEGEPALLLGRLEAWAATLER